MEDADLDAVGEEAAERRRRIEEERQGRTCPVCLSKPVAARMTKCGHVSLVVNTFLAIPIADIPDLLLPVHHASHSTVGHPEIGKMSGLRGYDTRRDAQECQIPRRGCHAQGGQGRGGG